MTSATPPWLSVLMPTYNGAASIRQALDSLLAQDGVEGIECIVIDDGSGDDTCDIVRAYADRLNLRLEQTGHGGNWVRNTNRALRLASAGHVCLLHQDDCWLPGRLACIRDMLTDSPDCSLYLHDARFIDDQGRDLGAWTCPLAHAPRGLDSRRMIERLLVQNFIAIAAPVFKRQQALALGGLDESLWYSADWDFWLRLAAAGTTLHRPLQLVCFRVHAMSQTLRRSRESGDFRQQLDVVLTRQVAAHPWLPALTRRVAAASVAVNAALAARYHGDNTGLSGLCGQLLRLGPAGWCLYWRHSRILERVSARLRARVRPA